MGFCTGLDRPVPHPHPAPRRLARPSRRPADMMLPHQAESPAPAPGAQASLLPSSASPRLTTQRRRLPGCRAEVTTHETLDPVSSCVPLLPPHAPLGQPPHPSHGHCSRSRGRKLEMEHSAAVDRLGRGHLKNRSLPSGNDPILQHAAPGQFLQQKPKNTGEFKEHISEKSPQGIRITESTLKPPLKLVQGSCISPGEAALCPLDLVRPQPGLLPSHAAHRPTQHSILPFMDHCAVSGSSLLAPCTRGWETRRPAPLVCWWLSGKGTWGREAGAFAGSLERRGPSC